MFSASLVFLSIYVYYDILRGSSSAYALVIAGAFALSGIAESLPEERRQAAGGVRMTVILLLLGLIALTMVIPELIIGGR